MAEKGVSLRPSDMVEGGGGLLDNADCLWKEVRFEMFDYGGTREETPALRITLVPEDGLEVDQYWSCGNAKNWNPSKDGKKLIPLSDKKTGIDKGSNAGILFASLLTLKFPEEKISDDITCFEGLRAHMVRVPAPKRAGLAQTKKRADGREFEPQVLVVEKIISLPWEKEGKGNKAEAGDESASEKASEAIVAILGNNPGGLDKVKLIGQVFTYLKKQAVPIETVNVATRLIREDAVEGPWTVEKGVYKM